MNNLIIFIIVVISQFSNVLSFLMIEKSIQNDFTWYGGFNLSYQISSINGDSISIRGDSNENIGSRGFESKELITGDYNVSLLFYQSSTCSNLGISIFEKNNFWDWNSKKGRISFQIDCGFPILLGECSVSDPFEMPKVVIGHWYRMTLSHKPSIGITLGTLYSVDNLIEHQIATLSISESYNNILYKYGICGDTNDNEKSTVFKNVSISSLSRNMINTDVSSHLLREKVYNLARPINSYDDFKIIKSSGMLSYELADPNNIGIVSLNIIGLSSNSEGVRGLESVDYLSGDSNISVSFYQGYDCSNAGLSIFPNQNYWKWGTHSGRISMQIDCGFPVLFGECAVDDHFTSPIVTPRSWYTMVLSHRPSLGQTLGYIYKGFDNFSDLVSVSMINESFPEMRHKFGICADQNDLGNQTQFDNLRVAADFLYESSINYVEEMFELSAVDLSSSLQWMGGSNLSFNLINGIDIYGDSRYSEGARGLESVDYLSGDSNISVSFYQGYECSNAGLSIFPNQNYWKWGAHSGRISMQIDCGFPVLFGECAVDDHFTSPIVTPGSWYTMVLSHRPSLGQTLGYIFRHFNDSSNRVDELIGELQLSEIFDTFHKYGISADSTDNYDRTHFKKLLVNTIKFTQRFGTTNDTHVSFNPIVLPTESPFADPTDEPTFEPTLELSFYPTYSITKLPTQFLSKVPSRLPSRSPSLFPSELPSKTPTGSPSKTPSLMPSVFPTRSPSVFPSEAPTFSPTTIPSWIPTNKPSCVPSSIVPSASPSFSPSATPSSNPSAVPSASPTFTPAPTITPTGPSLIPTYCPTVVPSYSYKPTEMPSTTPSSAPSINPTITPTFSPSFTPSQSPSITPSSLPSFIPTCSPTMLPSIVPSTCIPSVSPTTAPSFIPSHLPSILPSNTPTTIPTETPTVMPSRKPSISPSFSSSKIPSRIPSMKPSKDPPTIKSSALPTVEPTNTFTRIPISPSIVPSIESSINPSVISTIASTKSPSSSPIISPSLMPLLAPSMVSSTLPTVKRTVMPNLSPSISPSYITTLSQSMKPTIATTSKIPNRLPVFSVTQVPSLNPTTEVPTYIPTPLPAPQMSFVNVMSVQGLKNGCASMSDNTTLSMFLISQSTIMNISESNLRYQGCETASRRLISKELNSRFNLQNSYNLATKIIIFLNNIDTTKGGNSGTSNISTIATAIFQRLSSTLSTSVKNGTFALVMQATAKTLKVISNTSSIQVTSSTSTGMELTIFTYSPTKIPSFKPTSIPTIYQTALPTETDTFIPTQQSISSRLSAGAIVGIVIAVIILIIIAVALLIFYKQRVSKDATVYIESTIERGDENQPVAVNVKKQASHYVSDLEVMNRRIETFSNDHYHYAPKNNEGVGFDENQQVRLNVNVKKEWISDLELMNVESDTNINERVEKTL